MRPFFQVAPTLWTGKSGREWRLLGMPFQILGVYVQTSPAANQYGLYYVSQVQIAAETGIAPPTIRKVLDHFRLSGFAYYCPDTEWIWVVKMTYRQLGLNGCPLSSNDKRILGVNRWYDSLPDNPWLGPYYDRYATLVRLSTRREGSATTLPLSPSPAPPPPDPGAALIVASPPPSRLSQDDLFELWWKHYPKKHGKRAARAEWAQIRPIPTEAFVLRMIETLKQQKRTTQWIKDNGQFVPDPERYLRKGRYLDETAEYLPSLDETEAATLTALDTWTPPHD